MPRLSACLLALLLTSPLANAGDAAPGEAPPSFDWTGFYVGVQGGLQFQSDDDGDAPPSVREPDEAEGPAFGGLIGYDHQFGSFVLGVEGDAQWLGGAGDTASAPPR